MCMPGSKVCLGGNHDMTSDSSAFMLMSRIEAFSEGCKLYLTGNIHNGDILYFKVDLNIWMPDVYAVSNFEAICASGTMMPHEI